MLAVCTSRCPFSAISVTWSVYILLLLLLLYFCNPYENIVIMSDMFNIYTCTEEYLTSMYDVGPVSAARIIELRERVIRNEIPLLTVEDLAQIRLNRESWQQLIVENKFSIEFQTAKVKISLVAGIGTPTHAQPLLMEAVELDMTPPHVPITPNLRNPNLDHD